LRTRIRDNGTVDTREKVKGKREKGKGKRKKGKAEGSALTELVLACNYTSGYTDG
jgi:hypothetical protein